MLTRIRNSIKIKAKTVSVLKNNLNIEICKVLQQNSFIEAFEESGPLFLMGKDQTRKFITIKLKYKGPKQNSYITNLKRISKPGLRVYTKSRNIQKVLGGIGIAVFA